MRDHPLWHLTLARWRELLREPGIVFWVFGFPIILAVGLGVAFREAPPDTSGVAAAAGAAATDGRYIEFLIPGLIGLNLMSSSLWGIAYSIVLNRKRGLLKRFAATPMRRHHYLLAYVLSRLGLLVLEVAALVAVGWVLFGVAVQGSLLALISVALLGAASFGGIGVMIAARIENTEVATGWMNLVMLPMWMLSGSFFAYERFPEVVWPLIQLLPLTALNDALRAITSGSPAPWGMTGELAVLAAWGLVSFAIAQRRFRWQ